MTLRWRKDANGWKIIAKGIGLTRCRSQGLAYEEELKFWRKNLEKHVPCINFCLLLFLFVAWRKTYYCFHS